jgi:preprotein translocase subunit SecF
MNTTKEPSEITAATTNAQRRRCHAIAMILGGSAAIALLALFGTTGPGTPETAVASGTVQLMDSATPAPLQVQDVDDSDDEAQLQQQNNATQMMIQSEQQAEEQNELAQQQALQDELQAQQTEQQADQ